MFIHLAKLNASNKSYHFYVVSFTSNRNVEDIISSGA